MSSAKVITQEVDLSTRVPSFPGVFGGIVLKARKGPLEPTLVTNDTQLLNTFTPAGRVDVGDDTAYFSALAFLQRSDKLWVSRAVNGALSGGLVARQFGSTPAAFGLPAGLSDPTAYLFDSLPDIAGEAEVFTVDVAGATPAGIDGRGFVFADLPGSVGLFVDVDDSGTVAPAEVAAATRQIEENTIVAADVDTDIATKLAATLSADAEFSAVAVGTVITVTNANPGFRGDPTDDSTAPTNFTFVVTTQGVDEVDAQDEAIIFYNSDPGAWQVAITVTNFDTDPELVGEPGAFLIQIFAPTNLNVPIEQFVASRDPEARNGFGSNIYVEEVLLGSNYLRAFSNPMIDPSIGPADIVTPQLLTGGDNGAAVTDSELITAAKRFENRDELQLTVLMDGGNSSPAYQLELNNIATKRNDCVGIFSTPFSAESSANYLNDIVDYRQNSLNLDSSRSAIYTPHVKVFDRFNDRDIFAAPDGYAGAAISFSASNFEIWFPPAGFTRGNVTVLDLRRRFTTGEMDVLYAAGINPLRFVPGRGIYIWGQRTLQTRPSALDRLNVRLLLIVIEPAISEALENFLFELNDEATRSRAEAIVTNYMDRIRARRGVTDFDVVANDSNNTPEDIDAGRLNLDLFVKPTRSIEEIPFRVVITSTGISFDLAASLV